uniref:Ig-like domain-containing protein n=1 Tax=Cyprinus carpio TaxID=7962 RepID=A0A8C2F2U0_CYPCA
APNHTIVFTLQCVMTADQIRPNKDAVVIKEDETVSLSCSYDTSSSYVYLYWYRQYPNGQPQYLIFRPARSATTTGKPRFSATLDSTSRTVPLMIKNLRVSDSAVYYCALRPTVTVTHSTLTQYYVKVIQIWNYMR